MSIDDKGTIIEVGASPIGDAGTITRTETAHAVETYLPESEARRSGIALGLSGGGFRAALFHLGALRRLNELGILSKISTISSVSGGSIMAAHLADRVRPWPSPGTVYQDWEPRVAAPFRAFTAKNLRTGPLLERLWPWNWWRTSTAVEALAARYEKDLIGLKMSELPDRPLFVFCATDMAFGVNWVFEKRRVGDYQAGYASPPPDWSVARAVAASSCFPPVFNPLPANLRADQLTGGKAKEGPVRAACIAGLRLTDGGNYDNMGLEPVWKTHQVVLVSDGGATFHFEADKNLIWRLSRYTEILGNQALALRKRWLIAGFISGVLKGTYWGVGSVTAHYGPETSVGYSKELVEEIISKIRTDLDAFSQAEIAVLENHGYLMAEAAIRCHVLELALPVAVPLRIPHPQWMDELQIREALAESHKRRLLGRY